MDDKWIIVFFIIIFYFPFYFIGQTSSSIGRLKIALRHRISTIPYWLKTSFAKVWTHENNINWIVLVNKATNWKWLKLKTYFEAVCVVNSVSIARRVDDSQTQLDASLFDFDSRCVQLYCLVCLLCKRRKFTKNSMKIPWESGFFSRVKHRWFA